MFCWWPSARGTGDDITAPVLAFAFPFLRLKAISIVFAFPFARVRGRLTITMKPHPRIRIIRKWIKSDSWVVIVLMVGLCFFNVFPLVTYVGCYAIPLMVLVTWLVLLLDTLTRRQSIRARRRHRARLNHCTRLNLCPKCNYDRAGIGAGAVCPECGERPTIV